MKVEELVVMDKLAIAITSMTKAGDKLILGLTGGTRALAIYDLKDNSIKMGPEIFPWVKGRGYCTKIHNSMGLLSDGSILLGEGNHFTWDGIPVTVNYFNHELPEKMLSRKREQGYPDVKYTDFCLENLSKWDRAETDQGGRILKFNPLTEEVEEIGKLPQFLYSQSMIVDTARNRAFGHTLPDNRFFLVDVKKKEIRDFGHISDYAHHNMVITPNGICYGAWIDKADRSLKLLKFDPDNQKLEYLNKTILKDPGQKVAGNQGIDQWIVTSKGRIFVGTVANSLLFEFFPENEEFELIGQLAKGGRVTSMNEDGNGIIWIGADYPHMRLIRFDPVESGKKRFYDCGIVNTLYERCYFHASCCFEEKLYLGETDGFSPSLHIVDLKTI
jgi:hypothetical protein